jgi:hypothetical protein
MGFREVCKYLIYSSSVLPFFFQYVTSAKEYTNAVETQTEDSQQVYVRTELIYVGLK